MLSAQPQPAAEPLDSHPDIHVGRDGWLFLIGGTNKVLHQFGTPGFSRMDLWRWRRLLAWRARRCAALGAVYLHTVAPEKLTVCRDAVDGLAFDVDRAPVLRLRRWLRLSRARAAWVDLVEPLRAARREVQTFAHTDSHWTFEGCEIVYRTLCRAMAVAPRTDFDARRSNETVHFSGDLGVKFNPQRSETARSCRFASEARRVYANDFLRRLEESGRGWDAHIGAHVVYRNEDPKVDPRRLVVFGDSYCQHGPTIAVATLTAFLADTFREVHFVWSTSIDWTYLAEVRPDIVLTEIAERFMVDLPLRGFRIEHLAELAMGRGAGA